MVTIGVTGHRFLTEVDKIATGVDKALCQIEYAFGGQAWTVISPLAEGADRLVAQRVLARSKARLVVPLPLPQRDYIADFGSDESRNEFYDLLSQAEQIVTLPPTPTRGEAYAAAGTYVLDHCDVLIAIWDGQTAQGIGGSGDIVAQARRRGLPLAWILAGNRRLGTQEPTVLTTEQGEVVLERFPATKYQDPDGGG